MEVEHNNMLNFLDVTTYKRNNLLSFKIYRKPTTTDITIHASSNHPYTHKMATFNALAHRLTNIPMDIEDYNDEINIIKHIAIVNGYNSKIIDKIKYKHANKLKRSDKVKHKT